MKLTVTDRENKSANEWLDLMYENTDPDGSLTIERCDDIDPENTWEDGFRMKWDRPGCADWIKISFALLRDEIKAASSGAYKEGGLPEDLGKYLDPLDIGDADPMVIEEINENMIPKSEFTEKQKAEWDKMMCAWTTEAGKRFGKDPLLALKLINRAQRYLRLLELGAPQIITDNEGVYLAEAMALCEYGEAK